jgi:hypothetical protein
MCGLGHVIGEIHITCPESSISISIDHWVIENH